MNKYKLKEFSKMVGISEHILRKMHKSGEFCGVCISTNPMFYTDDHVELFKRKFLQVPELKEYIDDK